MQGGILAPDQLRQMKNTCDSYIQKGELVQRPDQLTRLQYHMMPDFTRRVERLHRGRSPSRWCWVKR